jgi:hypothetical protein
MEGPGACGTPGPSKPFPGIGSPPGPTGHVQGLTPAADPGRGSFRRSDAPDAVERAMASPS